MSQPLVMSGAEVRLYINNKVYSPVQSISVEVDLGVYENYGINSPDPQEIASGQRKARGVVSGLRIKNSGGLQGINAIPLFSDIAAGNYISFRVEHRSTGENLWVVNKARITRITEMVQIKGTYKFSFQWSGQLLYWPLDLS